jgi:hypothetical protein
MILIISKNGDSSTTQVMRWLKLYNADVIRINFSDIIENKIPISLNLSSNDKNITIGNLKLDDLSLKKTVVWLRKLALHIPQSDSVEKKLGYIYSHVQKEYNTFLVSLMHLLKDAKWLCPIEAKDSDKIQILDEARKCGLNIPETIILNNKKFLEEYLELHPTSITKCLSDGLSINLGTTDTNFLLSTTILKNNHLSEIPSFFIPSTVQNYIEKEYELRIFYIDGKFFTTAIFSQKVTIQPQATKQQTRKPSKHFAHS